MLEPEFLKELPLSANEAYRQRIEQDAIKIVESLKSHPGTWAKVAVYSNPGEFDYLTDLWWHLTASLEFRHSSQLNGCLFVDFKQLEHQAKRVQDTDGEYRQTFFLKWIGKTKKPSLWRRILSLPAS